MDLFSVPKNWKSFSQPGILKSKGPGVWVWFSPVSAVEDALICTLLQLQLWTGEPQEQIVVLFLPENFTFSIDYPCS